MTANDVTRSLDISTEQDRFGGSYRFRSFSHSKSDPGYGGNTKLVPKPSSIDEGASSSTRKHQQQRAVIVTTTKQTQQQQQPLVTNRYKTELCRPFQEYGHCRYGDKCQFAHGKDDLKTPIRHPKYKTELCRTYHSQGYCPYGARCHFVHSTVEVRPSPAATMVPGRSTCPPAGSGNVRPPHLTSHIISFNKPPLSPSQDSGISSPPDTGTPNSVKMFEYPLSDGSSSSDDQDADFKDAIGGGSWGTGTVTAGAVGSNVNDLQFTCDPSSNWDTLSNESFSPMKNVPFYADPIDDLSDHFSTTSLDDGLSLNRTSSRLPIFNQLNSFSDTSLLSSQQSGDW